MAPSRPTTPIGDRRRSGRYSRRSSGIALPSQSPRHFPIEVDNLPTDSTDILNKFKNIADSMDDLCVNMKDLNHIHNAISGQFNESFASFLYGLSLTMWCVSLPKCPSKKAWQRLQLRKRKREKIQELKTKLIEAEKLNGELKNKLAEESKSFIRPRSQQGTNTIQLSNNKRLKFNNENVNNTSIPYQRSHNIPSRIPQPIQSNQTQQQKQFQNKRTPNLNQPPRYMRGLFNENINQSQPTTQTKSINKPISQRPPFK
ncbi:DAM1 [Candida pseudojiufengensis]|uniref:DAM1 n=1 Tax=Candida pseudojiufengensis TaxID=497109 RepID=UPI0022258013|nr:DAM1 [Candida pseudojiufengensis]KAI5963739.1 DAM1 [Candida pseudojiufengensis]